MWHCGTHTSALASNGIAAGGEQRAALAGTGKEAAGDGTVKEEGERGGTTYLVLCVGPRMPHNQKPATKTSQGCILDDFDSIGVCPIWFCGFRLQSRLP